MAHEQLPDWCREGETAYVVEDHNVSGVGSYPTTVRVTVERVTATQVKVRPTPATLSDAMTVFRRKDLTAPGTGRAWSASDRLAGPDDQEVRKAARLARIIAALPSGSDWDAALHRIQSLSRATVSQDMPSELDSMIVALLEIKAETDRALKILQDIRATI